MIHICIDYFSCELGNHQNIFIKDVKSEKEAFELCVGFINSFKDSVDSNNIKNIIKISPFEKEFSDNNINLFSVVPNQDECEHLAIINFEKSNHRMGSLGFSITNQVGWWNDSIPNSFREEDVINEILNSFENTNK